MEKISLLFELDQNDFEIIAEELSNSNLEEDICYHYAIDMYEIHEFCYPFGLRISDDNKTKKGIDYITDEQYTYYQLFYQKEEKVILLDEYIVELFNLRNYIQFTSNNGIATINSLKKYIEEFGKLDKSNFEEIVKTKLSLILAIAHDLFGQGITKLIQLIERNRIIINTEHFDSKNDVEINQAFASNKGSELTDKIYNIILEDKTPAYNSSLEQSLKEIAWRRDARVVDRIIRINEFLEFKFLEGKLEKRHIVLYLSSTDTSKKLFSNPRIKEYLPQIKGQSYNPLINTAQLFLKELCSTSTNKREIEENIQYLKKAVIEIKSFQKKIRLNYSPENPDLGHLLRTRFKYYRENFENYAILNRFDKIKELVTSSIEKIISQSNESKLKELLPVLEYIKGRGEKNEQKTIQDLIYLENWENQIKASYFLKMGMDEFIKDDSSKISISIGNDFIRSSVHHLPLVYKYSDNAFVEIINSISEILLFPSKNITSNEIKDLIFKLYEKTLNTNPSLYERLLKGLFLLLIPNSQGTNHTNLMAYLWMRNILEKEIINSQQKTSQDNRDKESDFRYFIGWASRRCKKYEESIDIFVNAIKKFTDDPRFYHGLSLTKYCVFKDAEVTKKSINKKVILEECLNNSKKAYELYQTWTGNDTIINKMRSTLLNTMSYFYCELYELDISTQNDYLIINARELNTKLKIKEPEYKDYPEYLHTEAYLELLEFKKLLFKLNNDPESEIDKDKARAKINYALGAIIIASEDIFRNNIYYNPEPYNQMHNLIIKEKESFLNKYYK